MAERIEIHEVGLRDGLQNIKTVVPTDQKLAWIKAEHAAGVREIEVCSFVPPKLLPQFADAEEVTRRALAIPGLAVAALMPNLKGAERGAALGVHKLNYVVSVSEGGGSYPVPPPVPMYARAEMAQAADTKVEPGEQKLQVNLAMVFELQ